MVDIYEGGGLKGIPRGAVKKLRVFAYHFAYHGMSGGYLDVLGVDGPCDIKRVLGTVPVEKDGSAYFVVPANTPISVQPLDSEGKALQLMRSWMTAMPGEVLSCVGCHENQNSTPVNRSKTLAISRPPSTIEPWYGPTRGFSYPREVQPVVDKYCIGCHNDKPGPDGKSIPDFTGTKRVKDYHRRMDAAASGSDWIEWDKDRWFSVGYVNLHRYVRRPGLESDYHMLAPMDFHADTTELVRILRKGHHGVSLDAEAWDRLVTWIDLNTPFYGFWTEACHDPGRQRRRRRELQKLYAGLDEDPEADMRLKPAVLKPLTDAEKRAIEQADPKPGISKPECPGWPFDAAGAKKRQAAARSATTRTFDLGGVKMELVLIPAGEFLMGDSKEFPRTRVKSEKPFWMGKFEVTNEQFKLFAPDHDSHVEGKLGYQFGVQGYPLDRPRQPVVRVSWRQAMGFCRWLSQKTGRTFTLPTEAQWEYACRAGTDTPFYYGGMDSNFAGFANLADATIRQFASEAYTLYKVVRGATVYDHWVPRDARFNDGCLVTADVGAKQPNAWGLHDMHGNAAEWTRSADMPYPYRDSDGRNAITRSGSRIVRGGSWRDRPRYCRSGSRLGYRWYQPVFNVGFRVICEVESAKAIASVE
jgi:formylglycine-generating enzyme required for sulfatase activity